MPYAPNAETLSDHDLTLMKRIVIGVVPGAEKLTRLSASPAAREGCRAQQFLDNNLCQAHPTAGTHLQHARHAVAFYTTAGFDHMRAFVTVLKTGRHIFPLATLTRGAVEAFAKANYLLRSTSAADLILRYVGLACSELRFRCGTVTSHSSTEPRSTATLTSRSSAGCPRGLALEMQHSHP